MLAQRQHRFWRQNQGGGAPQFGRVGAWRQRLHVHAHRAAGVPGHQRQPGRMGDRQPDAGQRVGCVAGAAPDQARRLAARVTDRQRLRRATQYGRQLGAQQGARLLAGVAARVLGPGEGAWPQLDRPGVQPGQAHGAGVKNRPG